jgi:SAM-dependent methyltransferase
MKNFTFLRRSFRDLQRIHSYLDTHRYFIVDAIKQYELLQKKRKEPLGRVLFVCANYREALFLREFAFEEILITGILDPDERMLDAISQDSRISYRKENCENLNLPSRSFDLVFCKAGLHHLARPVQGFYEMLRVCKKAVIIVEGYNCLASRILTKMNLATVYERNLDINIEFRDNYVFRWSKSHLQEILNSYYLDSGYHAFITLGWYKDSVSLSIPKIIKYLGNCIGYMMSFIPGFKGNWMTAMITPGSDIPPEPIAICEKKEIEEFSYF